MNEGQDLPRVHLIAAAEYHDVDYVRRVLLGLLAEDDRIRSTCTNGYADIASVSPATFLITYTSNVFPRGEELVALRRFIERGGRWLAIHGSAAYTEFEPPPVDVGGIRLPGLTATPDRVPDYMDLLGCRFVSHLAPQPYAVSVTAVDHVVTRGLPTFEIEDEPYILELRADVDVLLESRYTGTAPGYVAGPWLEDRPRPQMLLHRLGMGEVIYLAPGHACGRFDLRPFIDALPAEQRGPWTHPTYLELLRRTIRWGTRPRI